MVLEYESVLYRIHITQNDPEACNGSITISFHFINIPKGNITGCPKKNAFKICM